jgi:hypothetical protein
VGKAERVRVVELERAVIIVLGRIPSPITPMPATSPVVLPTVIVKDEVAVLPVIVIGAGGGMAVTTVFAGMPEPLTPKFTAISVLFARPAILGTPLVVFPIMVKATGMERVMVVEVFEATVAPIGMPLPITAIPTDIPVVLATEIVGTPLIVLVFPVSTSVAPITRCFWVSRFNESYT